MIDDILYKWEALPLVKPNIITLEQYEHRLFMYWRERPGFYDLWVTRVEGIFSNERFQDDAFRFLFPRFGALVCFLKYFRNTD